MSIYHSHSEADLLALVKVGDDVAFDELYRRHWSVMFGSAYNILRDREACMDIIQDIFVWFWENRAQCTLSSCRGYLLTAVKFKTANYIRNAKNRGHVIQHLSAIALRKEESEDFEVKQLEEFIRGVASELPERCKEIFQLSRYAYLNNKEIAHQLNISEKTVENQLTIALKRLRQKLSASYLFLLM